MRQILPPLHQPPPASAGTSRLPSSAALAFDAIPFTADATVAGDLDVAFSTHLSVVVLAQIEFSGDLSPPMEVSLVIPRAQCRAGRPLLIALKAAALVAIDRNAHSWEIAGLCPRQLSIRVNQRRYALYAFAR